MYSLTRLLFRALNGKPVAQVIVGIALIPAGILISIASMSGEYIYPYWVIAGIVFAIVGVIFIVRGAKTLLKPKPLVQQSYIAPNQYAQPQPYAAPNPYPYGQQQPYVAPNQYAPYGQQPQPQQSYANPNPYAPQQQSYMPPAYSQPYEQVQYPQE